MTPLENKVSPRTLAEQKYKNARNDLLLMIVFTVVNIVLLLFNSGVMMLFSATIPYYATAFGMMVDSTASMTVLFAVAAVSIIAYLVCWIFSKKHFGWIIAAMVLFVIDTAAMVGLYIMVPDVSGILDLGIHALVLYYLIVGVVNGNKLRTLPEESEQEVFEDL